MAERINSITRAILAAAAIVVCLTAPLARGQIDPLPDPTKTSYTQPDIDQIVAFTQKRVGAIGGEDAQAREKARAEILGPLRRPGVSVAFRRAVREATIDRLTELADDRRDDGGIAINALTVLGEIADDACRQVVQRHTDDEILAVRYAAVGAMNRTFRVVETFQPAIDPNRVAAMVDHLQARLVDEKDANVADAIVRALLQAARIRRDGFDAAATRAVVAAASGVGVRLRHADPTQRPFALMSCHRVGEHLAARLQAPGVPPPEVSRAAAAFGGEVLGRLAFEAREGQIGQQRDAEVKLAQVAERNIVFSRLKLGSAADDRNLWSLLEAGNDAEFYDQVRRFVLGLSGPPTSLPGGDMKRVNDAIDGG